MQIITFISKISSIAQNSVRSSADINYLNQNKNFRDNNDKNIYCLFQVDLFE